MAAVGLSATVWAYACGDGATEPAPTPDPPRPTTVTVTPASAELTAIGATVQLAAQVRDQNGQAMPVAAVTWSSGATEVATVTAAGLVTAAGNGTATITATAAGASGTATVTVAQEVSAVTITPAADTLLALGDTVRLSAEASDANGHAVEGAVFAWASADTLVAVVDSAGLVTAAGNGTATIAASVGEASGSAVVTVLRTFTLSGTVRDGRRNGPMLAGAVVRLENGKQESVTTGPDGHFSVQNVWGTVAVTVTAEPSYVAETVAIAMDADRTVEFALRHTGIPPFRGLSGVGDILDASDPTWLRNVTYAGRGERVIADRRTGGNITVDAYVFDVQYDGPEVEFRVNPEFGSVKAAQTEVEKYASAIGRLPAVFLSRLRKVDINAGDVAFGGSGRIGRVLIHTGRGEAYMRRGILEEILLHEAGHVSLDPTHRFAPDWLAAQQADGVFISDYARDHPVREDVTVSIWAYFAVMYRPERLSQADRAAILAAIPNRLAYFDEQGFDMSPYERRFAR
jgi:hypothetical protein